MTFDIQMHIDSQSPEGHALETLITREDITPEEAIRRLLASVEAADTENYDHLFTPTVIAELDNISAEINAGGKTYSMAEVREHFAEKRTAWLAEHQG